MMPQYSNTYAPSVTPTHHEVGLQTNNLSLPQENGSHKSSSGACTATISQSNPYGSSINDTPIDNPYQKRNLDMVTPSTERSRPKSLVRQQHPHRVGRIRVDRQFSTAIAIGSDLISSSQEDHGFEGVNEMCNSVLDLSSASSDDDDVLAFIPFQSH